MLDGAVYARTRPVLPCGETGSGSSRGSEWPRPAASDSGGARDPDGRRGFLLRDLEREQRWARPTLCGDYNVKGASKNSGDGLRTQVIREAENWPRPVVADGERGSETYLRGNPTRFGAAKAAELPWPRPDASAANDGEDVASWEARRQRVIETGVNGNGMGTPLGIAVRQEEIAWPRPKVSDADKGAGVNDRGSKGDPTLPRAVWDAQPGLWPRPKASDAEKGSPAQTTRSGPALPGAVCREEPGQWPRVSDGLGGGAWSETERRANPATSAGGHSQKEMLGARLNPAREETLLGWPIGLVSGLDWTEYGRLVAERKREARRNTPGSPQD